MRVVSLLQLILQNQISAAVVSVKHRFSLSHVTWADLIAFERLLDFSSHTFGMASDGWGCVHLFFSEFHLTHSHRTPH